MHLWRVTIEGKADGAAFMQNFMVAANSRTEAERLAMRAFGGLGDQLVGIAETERHERADDLPSVRVVEGRIFFGNE